ncbi:hypothetical protein [Streptomyces aurantiogriseus]|uniref:hypothetical protein n=1 Tax=Streptomyces aurantiogriseus TaxID=66870 RepID=UPI001678FBB7|nr:hypothetical protein [Streptomyces aurantiogriseus]
MRLPDRELTFYSRPVFQERWIEENRLLEFRCEFRCTYPGTPHPVLARLRARLVVRWDGGLPYMDKVGARLRTVLQRRSSLLSDVGAGLAADLMPGFTLDEVEDVDFAVSLNGNKVFDVSGAVPTREWQSLVVSGDSRGSARISDIDYPMKRSLENMTKIRSGRTA